MTTTDKRTGVRTTSYFLNVLEKFTVKLNLIPSCGYITQRLSQGQLKIFEYNKTILFNA